MSLVEGEQIYTSQLVRFVRNCSELLKKVNFRTRRYAFPTNFEAEIALDLESVKRKHKELIFEYFCREPSAPTLVKFSTKIWSPRFRETWSLSEGSSTGTQKLEGLISFESLRNYMIHYMIVSLVWFQGSAAWWSVSDRPDFAEETAEEKANFRICSFVLFQKPKRVGVASLQQPAEQIPHWDWRVRCWRHSSISQEGGPFTSSFKLFFLHFLEL